MSHCGNFLLKITLCSKTAQHLNCVFTEHCCHSINYFNHILFSYKLAFEMQMLYYIKASQAELTNFCIHYFSNMCFSSLLLNFDTSQCHHCGECIHIYTMCMCYFCQCSLPLINKIKMFTLFFQHYFKCSGIELICKSFI